MVAWCKGIDKFGSLPVLLSSVADLPPMMTREQVFDRWALASLLLPCCFSLALAVLEV